MAHFVIAGKANDPDYARAEMLAHHLHINMPDFHIQLIPKHPDEWDEYARQVFIQNGWAKRMARDRTIKSPERLGGQMIWRESGELIGNAKDFIKLIRETYDQEYILEDSTLQDIAKENMAELSPKKGKGRKDGH